MERKSQETAARVFNFLGEASLKKIIEKETANTLLRGTTLTASGTIDFSLAEKRFFKLPPAWLKLVIRFLKKLTAALEDIESENIASGKAGFIALPVATEAELISIGLDDLVRRGEITSLETELISKNGQKKTVEISASALKNSAGTIQGMVITAKDVSKIQKLARNLQMLRELDKTKSEFISIASHQVRTPLTGIKWTINSLLEEQVGKLNVKQKKITSDAYKAVLRLVELINNLLDVSRLEEGRLGFRFQNQALELVVKKVFENFRKEAKEKGITFSLSLPESPLPFIKLDTEKISIALNNLVDNAIKYTSPSGTINIEVLKKGKLVLIKIKDTGIGIPADQIDQMFTKFFRAKNAQNFQTSGTGLGMYVTKNIIERHGGAISLQSEENKGSVFSVTFPV